MTQITQAVRADADNYAASQGLVPDGSLVFTKVAEAYEAGYLAATPAPADDALLSELVFLEHSAATGKWCILFDIEDDTVTDKHIGIGNEAGTIIIRDDWGFATQEDLELICALRNAAPALLARLRKAEAAAAASAAQVQQWQSVATAPKDGTQILLLLKNGRIVLAYWEENLIDAPTKKKLFNRVGGWATDVVISWQMQEDERFAENEGAHWQPLPSLPSEKAAPTDAR